MRKPFLALAVAALCSTTAHADDPGRQAFEVCAACHSLKAGENGNGPSLHNILGQTAGKVEGFRYSGPMKRSGIVWDAASLTAFLRNPQEAIPGNRMPFSGNEDEAALQALVRYVAEASR